MIKREPEKIKYECAPNLIFVGQIGKNHTKIVDGYGFLGNLSLKIGLANSELNQFNRTYTQNFQTQFILKKDTGIYKC